jgi:hypothetical protein
MSESQQTMSEMTANQQTVAEMTASHQTGRKWKQINSKVSQKNNRSTESISNDSKST